MALIKCSECNKEISDKASDCIHCGCPIGLKCDECGKELDSNTSKCSYCGYEPVSNKNPEIYENKVDSEINKVKIPNEKHLGLAIAGLVCSLVGLLAFAVVLGPLAIIFGGIALSSNAHKNKARSYGMASLVIGIIDVIGWLLTMMAFF